MLTLFRLSLSAAALCGVCVLSSCVFNDVPPPEPELPPTPLAAYMIAHTTGDTATIEAPDYGGTIRVTMQDTFLSAAGEECKRASLTAKERETEMAVICRKEHGRWLMAPRIWGQGIK